jgi:hypothetical protein
MYAHTSNMFYLPIVFQLREMLAEKQNLIDAQYEEYMVNVLEQHRTRVAKLQK